LIQGLRPNSPIANHERAVEQPALFEIRDQLEQDPVQLGDQHLVDFVLEDVIVPAHAVGDHHKRRAMLHQVQRHERVLAKLPRRNVHGPWRAAY